MLLDFGMIIDVVIGVLMGYTTSDDFRMPSMLLASLGNNLKDFLAVRCSYILMNSCMRMDLMNGFMKVKHDYLIRFLNGFETLVSDLIMMMILVSEQ